MKTNKRNNLTDCKLNFIFAFERTIQPNLNLKLSYLISFVFLDQNVSVLKSQ